MNTSKTAYYAFYHAHCSCCMYASVLIYWLIVSLSFKGTRKLSLIFLFCSTKKDWIKRLWVGHALCQKYSVWLFSCHLWYTLSSISIFLWDSKLLLYRPREIIVWWLARLITIWSVREIIYAKKINFVELQCFKIYTFSLFSLEYKLVTRVFILIQITKACIKYSFVSF